MLCPSLREGHNAGCSMEWVRLGPEFLGTQLSPMALLTPAQRTAPDARSIGWGPAVLPHMEAFQIL